MAFFKPRKGGDESAATPRQPLSVEAIRRRARHRLIGAGVLVLIGILGFPLLFDTQPRPIAVDIPIEIPDRNKVAPLPAPAPAPGPAVVTHASAPVAPPPVAMASNAPAPAPTSASAPAIAAAPAKTEPKPETKVEARPEPKVEAKSLPTAPAPAPARKDDGAKAQALLEGKAAATPVSSVTPASAAAEARFVVQVGAFADAAKARDTRLKVEKAGLKTYTNVAETKDGKRTRVRVGPFASRAEAEKAAEKIKGLDLPAAILSL